MCSEDSLSSQGPNLDREVGSYWDFAHRLFTASRQQPSQNGKWAKRGFETLALACAVRIGSGQMTAFPGGSVIVGGRLLDGDLMSELNPGPETAPEGLA